MSGSRFVLKQIHVRGSAGPSDLTRYVAKSKLDHTREGKTARALFTAHADDLTCVEAQKWLSVTGGALEKEDVLHYVLSFKRRSDYELLGETDGERGREIIAFLRKALPESLRQIGIEEMRWVAGIHRNTDNPHVHLLINKNAIHLQTKDIVRVPYLPAPFIAHHKRTQDNQREFSYGLLINSFAAEVDLKHRARTRYLRFENALGTIIFSRELLSPEVLRTRIPTNNERLVGMWFVAEIEAARPPEIPKIDHAAHPAIKTEIHANKIVEDEHQRNLASLREQVSRLDRAALERGEKPPCAFVETDMLRSILTAPQYGFSVIVHEQEPSLVQTRQHDFSHHQPEHGGGTHHRAPAPQHDVKSADSKEHLRLPMPPTRTRSR